MSAEMYSIKYGDKDAAKLVYRQIASNSKDLGFIACGLESYRTGSRRARKQLKITVAVAKDEAQNLPSILKAVEKTLETHPLYPYLSFDSTATPLSQIKWNFDSYDDPNYQKIFIRKRQKG